MILYFCAGKPYIIAVHPSEGWVTGGTKVCIVGMNFYEGVEVVFGTLPATSEVCVCVHRGKGKGGGGGGRERGELRWKAIEGREE